MAAIVVVSIVYVPAAVTFIIRTVRRIKGVHPRFMGLQWYNSANELRLTIGLHDANNVPAAMRLIEMLKAASDVGMVVYAMDMVELSDENKAALVYRPGTDAVTVADEGVIELREQIRIALDAHLVFSGGEGVVLNRNVVMSSFADMHDDICCSAQDTLSVLVLLPFHISHTADEGHHGFKNVNALVMQHAPCSVGICVDRGLGKNTNLLTEEEPLSVVVVFIGGADDREALACAGLIAQHPCVRLLVLRIIPDKEAIAVDGPGRRIVAAMPQREVEMTVDDEFFAGFYENCIATGTVEYTEKHTKNGAETVRALREMEGEHHLFIVGQGNERNSILTAGLAEWAECPELGPIGDILADPDFSSTTSVLVIKQQSSSSGSQYVSDEFMPM